MKRLSDYTGKEAIELWADIFDPMSILLTDEEISQKMTGKDVALLEVAKAAMKSHGDLLFDIITRIDDEEINGANILNKVVILLMELRYGDKTSAFFKSAEPETSEEGSSGSATENTEGGSI